MKPLRVLLIIAASVWLTVSSSWAAEPALNRIARSNEVRACIWPDYYGLTYRSSMTQELSGMDIEMAKALAHDLGVRVTFVDTTLANIGADLRADRCDIAMFAIATRMAARQPMRMSRPYLRSDVFAVAHKGSKLIQSWADVDKRDVVVAVPTGTYMENDMTDRFKNAHVVSVQVNERVRELRSGRVDVFLTNFTYSRRVATQEDWAKVYVPPQPFFITDYAYATPVGDDEWGKRIDAFIDQVNRDGRMLDAARQFQLQTWLVGRQP